MSKAVFEFYTVTSNSSRHPDPRIFFIKRKDEKILWSLEIEESLKEFRNAEFDREEAELWGVLIHISEGSVLLENEGEEEQVIFDEDILWGIETLFSHKNALSKSGALVYPCRWIPPERYRKNEQWIETEKRYMKQLEAGVASSLGNVYDYVSERSVRTKERFRVR